MARHVYSDDAVINRLTAAVFSLRSQWHNDAVKSPGSAESLIPGGRHR